MTENLRTFLYPLGFIASLCFGSRFLLQWYVSEKRGRSLVTQGFWLISLLGNGTMWLHSWIQMQFPVCAIQSCNLIVSWRNFQLLRNPRAKPSTPWKHLWKFPVGLVLSAFLFSIQTLWIETPLDWARSPQAPWQSNEGPELPLLWHIMGSISLAFFASRFWVQWWLSESRNTSQLSPAFWYLSLIGGTLSMIYFIPSGDSVQLLGHALGVIPYVRNLFLILRPKAQECLS